MLRAVATEEARVARDKKFELLRSVPLFARFDRHHLERLGMLTEEIDVQAGKLLIRQGDAGDDLMIIVSGQVGVERNGARINQLGPGDFFGEIALIERGPRTATCTAEAPTRLLVVNHRDFHSLMEEFPEIATQVLLTLAQRVRTLEPTTIN
jgi:CRP/FNR family transcriptional regulator, cyclic AMP receptor protein